MISTKNKYIVPVFNLESLSYICSIKQPQIMKPQDLANFVTELKIMFDRGDSLTTISQWSHEQREGGKNVPYMAIHQKEADGTVSRIGASPTSKQKELKAFFEEVAPGMRILPKYTLYVDLTGVYFSERLSSLMVVSALRDDSPEAFEAYEALISAQEKAFYESYDIQEEDRNADPTLDPYCWSPFND